jgi:hypothetical protein
MRSSHPPSAFGEKWFRQRLSWVQYLVAVYQTFHPHNWYRRNRVSSRNPKQILLYHNEPIFFDLSKMSVEKSCSSETEEEVVDVNPKFNQLIIWFEMQQYYTIFSCRKHFWFDIKLLQNLESCLGGFWKFRFWLSCCLWWCCSSL